MKKPLLISVFVFFCIFPFNNLISQDKGKPEFKSNPKVYHYLIKDSLGAFIVKEINNPDGTISYSVIPKAHLQEENLNEKAPGTVIEWFNKQKKLGKVNGYVDSRIRTDALGYLYSKKGFMDKDTIGTARNKKNTLWWIVGSTAVAGGVTAIIFLLTKEKPALLEELPIQPFPTR